MTDVIKPVLNNFWGPRRLFNQAVWYFNNVRMKKRTAVLVNGMQKEEATYEVDMENMKEELFVAQVKVEALFDKRLGYLKYSETLLKFQSVNNDNPEEILTPIFKAEQV